MQSHPSLSPGFPKEHMISFVPVKTGGFRVRSPLIRSSAEHKQRSYLNFIRLLSFRRSAYLSCSHKYTYICSCFTCVHVCGHASVSVGFLSRATQRSYNIKAQPKENVVLHLLLFALAATNDCKPKIPNSSELSKLILFVPSVYSQHPNAAVQQHSTLTNGS